MSYTPIPQHFPSKTKPDFSQFTDCFHFPKCLLLYNGQKIVKIQPSRWDFLKNFAFHLYRNSWHFERCFLCLDKKYQLFFWTRTNIPSPIYFLEAFLTPIFKVLISLYKMSHLFGFFWKEHPSFSYCNIQAEKRNKDHVKIFHYTTDKIFEKFNPP